jgi:hypothetical protein
MRKVVAIKEKVAIHIFSFKQQFPSKMAIAYVAFVTTAMAAP